MKSFFLFLALLVAGSFLSAQEQFRYPEITPSGKGIVNRYVDNVGYWNKMIRMGYVLPGPIVRAPVGKYTSSFIDVPGITPQDSPDIPVSQLSNVTQSENSIFIAPDNEEEILNSNNSSSWESGYAEDAYGADGLYSLNWGMNWAGSIFGAGEVNGGDPSTAISPTGRWFVGKIAADFGQSIAYSDDKGQTWKHVVVSPGPTYMGLLDKNHLWIDVAPSSPYYGYLYDGWTNFIPGTPDTNQVQISRSTDNGITWSSPFTISFAVNAGTLNHGVNLQSGPDGELYAAWSIYDDWPSDEQAIGFCKSLDGGGIFTPATRIITNTKGIRASMTAKSMRVNSFPSMAVDISTGPGRGTVYMVFANIGYPGINTGTDIDVYLIKSTDRGDTWSAPIRVNQDAPGLGKQHFFPWITCDPVTGGVCVIYYDDRNVDSTQVETFVAYSYDGGLTWTDLKVSDNAFTPAPIPGLAINYFGDYIGIQSRNMKVYPIWTDNHTGDGAMTYISPFDLGPNPGQPWVVYYSNSLTNIPADRAESMKYGDSLWLSLGLKNLGDQPASGIITAVSSPSPYVLVTDSTENYGNMAAEEIKVIPQGFAFKVSDTIPDNLRVRFDIRVSANDTSWYSHFSLEAQAPALKILSMTVIDTAGNNNGRLDPGETVSFRFIVTNSGEYPCLNTYSLLACNSEYITLQNDSLYLDTLLYGVMKIISFQCTVASEVPVSTGIDLLLILKSGLYEKQRSFRQSIGLLVEDWETNTFTKFPWQMGGSQPWYLSSKAPYEGVYCIHSGPIGNSSTSQIWVDYTSSQDDSISFYLKTSTEEGYDLLIFYIDNVQQHNWTGETPWTRASFPVTAGAHTFKWVYFKDLAYLYGQDKVWLDFIAFPPPVLPVVDPGGTGDTICAGQSYPTAATASGYDSLKWTTTGDGTYSNDTILDPTYLPGNNDIINGSVRLKLTGFATYGSVTRGMDLTIGNIPVNQIEVFPNDTVCAGLSVTLTADTAGITSLLWTPSNLTTPEIEMDTSLTGCMGTTLVHLISGNRFGCIARDSVFLTFRDCTAIEEKDGFRVLVQPNPNHGDFNLLVFSPKPDEISVRLFDPLNRLISEERFTRGRQFSHHFSLDNPPSGIYLLQIRRGDRETSLKVMIL